MSKKMNRFVSVVTLMRQSCTGYSRLRRAAGAVAIIGLALQTSDVFGAAKTWVGNSSVNWSDGANWGGAVPGTGDVPTFNAAGTAGYSLVDDIGGLSLGNILFSATAGSGYTIAGSSGVSLTLTTTSFTNNSSFVQTFNVPILHTSAGMTFLGGAGVTFGGLLTVNGANRVVTNSLTAGTLTLGAINLSEGNTGRTLTVGGVGTTALTGTIADGGSGAGTLSVSGSSVAISGANSYTGGTSITNGTTTMTGSGTLGATSGALSVINSATLDLNGTDQTVGGFSGANGSATVRNNNGGTTSTLTIGSGGGGGTFAGVLKDNSNAGTGKLALAKTGTGSITLSGPNTYTGGTTVNQGTLILAGGQNQQIRNSLIIGNGTDTAALTLDSAAGSSAITPAATVTVNTNGSLNISGKSIILNTVNIVGGTIDAGSGGILNQNNAGSTLTMTGGTITNGTFSFSNSGTSTITTNASSTTATIASTVAFLGNTAPIAVANGSALIDLDISGQMTNNLSFTKSGSGTMRLSSAAGSTNGAAAAGTTTVNAGLLLVSNTSGSATGQRAVQINGGGTLGGTGIIGGVATYSNANVTLTGTGTTASTVAALSPGDIVTVGGVDVSTIGASPLKIGGAAQANSLTFGNFSKLIAQLGNAGSSDQLAVTGNLNLNSAGNSDALNLQTITGATLSGLYTLATFSGTLAGRFDAITLDGGILPSNYKLLYKDSGGNVITDTSANIAGGSIVVSVPEPALLGVAGLVGTIMVSRRRSAVRV